MQRRDLTPVTQWYFNQIDNKSKYLFYSPSVSTVHIYLNVNEENFLRLLPSSMRSALLFNLMVTVDPEYSLPMAVLSISQLALVQSNLMLVGKQTALCELFLSNSHRFESLNAVCVHQIKT